MALSNLIKKEYLFTWKINNILMCPLETGERLVSPSFKAESLDGSEWTISIYPNGMDESCKHYVSLLLCRTQNEDKEITDFSIDFIGDDGELLKKFEEVNKAVNVSGCGLIKFYPLDLLNEKRKNWSNDSITFRCKIVRKIELSIQPAIESVALTKFGINRCCFEWNLYLLDTPKWEESKHIYFSENSQLKLTVATSNEGFEFEIQREDEDSAECHVVSCKISLINLKGHDVLSKHAKHIFENHSIQNNLKFPLLFSKKDLLSDTNDLLHDNTFTLKCDICVSNGEDLTEVESIKFSTPSLKDTSLNNSILALQEDLSNMLKSEKNCDISLQVENLTIPAHKSILCARSSVFSTMFDQNMLENQTGIVNIQDMDAKTLSSFLEFVYTGIINELNFDNAIQLLIAADKYQIHSLTERCSAFLISKLSIKNVCDIYKVADMINHKYLKSFTLNYIEKNSVKILKAEFWPVWMKRNVSLANEILFKLALINH